MSRCAALIVAAGRGSRFGGPKPKQYLDLAGQSVIRRAVLPFVGHAAVDVIQVVIHPDDAAICAHALAGLDLPPFVAGGASRQDSVRLGLESLNEHKPELVLIHDAARPFVTGAIIDRVLAALGSAPAAIAAQPVVDTLKRSGGGDTGVVVETIARAGLWRAQTPQGFHFEAILAAHRRFAGAGLTDDAAVAEQAGLTVKLVAGDEDNIKVTNETDWAQAVRIAAADLETRSATGFDVHRFAPGDAVTLCGVSIPHSARLEGHSDADVALHALTDALLGTIGEGDIGVHFPPSDQKWRGAESGQFLRHAAALVAQAGGRIVHVDLTLICERPKLGPHRDRMRAKLAELLAVPLARVSVKATTTEGLGFTGRGEGIAAQAIATVQLPPAAGG
ncbi:Bifunctional enzyme IspD/IspF [Candidatus Defluviicoccus seviourii]|uniref:Bifunctional enzyme IspD/IspF n=1 Tax=Candidatus Defluviicoccus seviourii TaxID=2565273 RepID=A0A564W8U0_9PROT|nr:Bifunctional enzyme IspD/IspF [Candidatus Defluviicoccus seviourii]